MKRWSGCTSSAANPGQCSVPPETRRQAINLKPELPLRGVVVVFGAGLITRTALSLIAGAARFLGRGEIRTLFFAEDETQAWAILAREGERLSAEQSPQ